MASAGYHYHKPAIGYALLEYLLVTTSCILYGAPPVQYILAGTTSKTSWGYCLLLVFGTGVNEGLFAHHRHFAEL